MTPRTHDDSKVASSRTTHSSGQSTGAAHLLDTTSSFFKGHYKQLKDHFGDTRSTYVLAENISGSIEDTDKISYQSTWRELKQGEEVHEGDVRYKCDRSQFQSLVPVEAPPLYLAKGKPTGDMQKLKPPTRVL
ncbi:hypothetical protein I302_104086 [Kwoniella bestiolae CBS 10118]|uniref:Uncharacterized protein n=1 Tax=Kwoniella bestiolae CBS 10118 TaxID=1296100 RepID=A0A1B9GAA8_9TREE|nr:hypothetical protein I302_02791 [Kwoniella bestiolae CBS 10118]OCF27941.1 hypothetical protein I302_02791 [Kwoniella bestiolae CBS 10118]